MTENPEHVVIALSADCLNGRMTSILAEDSSIHNPDIFLFTNVAID